MIASALLIGETVVFSYLAFVAGELLLRVLAVRTGSAARHGAYALMAGYGIFGFVGTILGAVGVFTPQALWGAALVILVASGPVLRSHWASLKRFRWGAVGASFAQESFGTMLLRFVIALWLMAIFFIVFVPITGHDTLDYHFPVMRALVETGTFDFSAASRTPLPLFGETLYAVPIAMFGETAAPFMFQVFQYIALVLLLILIYAFLRDRVRHPFFALLGVLFVLSLMDLLREVLHGGYVDVIGFLYGIASVLIVIEHVAEREARPSAPLSLSAVFLGVAMGIKYTGLIFGAFNGVVLLGVFLWRRERMRRVFAVLAQYALIAAAVAGIWYVKNAIVFGNPVYPMFSNAQATAEINVFLIDRTPMNLVAFPFYRYAQWFVQDKETSSRLIVLGYLMLMYILLAVVLILRRRLRASEFLMALFVLFYFAVLFFLSHQYRFLLPATIGLAVLLALLGDTAFHELRGRLSERAYRILFRGAVIVCTVAFLGVFVGTIHYFAVKFRYATGLYSQGEYVLEIGGQ